MNALNAEPYRGFVISQEYDLRYYATDPDLDCDYDYDRETFFQCSGMPQQGPGETIAEVKVLIDEYYEEVEA